METQPDYSKYKCYKCGFKFNFKKETKVTLRCPNCANPNVAKDDFNLNKIIDEV